MSEGLTASEWKHLVALLQRFAEHNLDQFDAWRLDTRHGPVFVHLTHRLGPDEPAEVFRPLTSPTGNPSPPSRPPQPATSDAPHAARSGRRDRGG